MTGDATHVVVMQDDAETCSERRNARRGMLLSSPGGPYPPGHVVCGLKIMYPFFFLKILLTGPSVAP